MPKFVCSYAFDVSCFTDFVVKARNKRAAHRKIKKALKDGGFKQVTAEPCWENGAQNERVFVQGRAAQFAPDLTLEELTGKKHLFSPHTRCCIKCGKHANDDAVENTPCTI